MNKQRMQLVVVTVLCSGLAWAGCEEKSEALYEPGVVDDVATGTGSDTEGQAPDAGGMSDAVSDVVSIDDVGGTEGDTTTALDTGEDTATAGDGGEDVPTTDDTSVPECMTDSDCQDFDNCTDDLCLAGVCENPPIVGCCIANEQCDDGIECTVDKCNFATQKCSHTPEDNLCCLDSSDCNDFNDCTLDACVNNQCIHPVNSSAAECACVLDILCDDSNACTEDKCIAGVCTYNALASSETCCGADADCDDGDAATQDACLAGLCWNGSAACGTAADCPTPSPCLESQCTDGACSWNQKAECCFTDAECDDGFELTTDRCLQGACVSTLGQPVACAADDDCAGSTTCVGVSCQATAKFCTFAPTSAAECCVQDSDCPAPPPGCGTATCDAFSCHVLNAEAIIPYWQESFDGPTLTWTVVEDATSAKWQLATAQYISADYSLYYGALPAKTIDVGTTEGTVTSPVITPDLSAPVMLSFQRNAAIEAITSVDKFWLEVVDEQSGIATEIWNKNYNLGPGLGWKSVLLDISDSVTGPFRLRFAFDSVDAIAGPLNEGVYVDDIRIGTPCN